MAEEQTDQLTEMLEDGWTVEGYSNTLMAAGAMTFSVLLRKENRLTAYTVVQNGAKEVVRHAKVLAPMQPQKKGWF
jgi:hypothetical protein